MKSRRFNVAPKRQDRWPYGLKLAHRKVGRETNNVRFGSKADMCSALGDVRFTPESGIKSRHSAKAVSAYPWLTAPPFMH